MFVALRKDGNRIVAEDCEDKKADYYCPVCGENVIFKNGIKRVKHFAHKPNTQCEYGYGETNEHLEVKQYLYKYFRERNIEVYPECTKWNGIRPDVAANINGKWVGFEIQKSFIRVDEIQKRMRKNMANGLSNIWILPQGKYDKMAEKETFRLSEQDIYLMKMYWGVLYVYGDGNIHAITCDNATGWHDEWYDEYGEYHDAYSYPLKSTFYKTCDIKVDLLQDFVSQDKKEFRNKNCYYPEAKIYTLNYSVSQQVRQITGYNQSLNR